LLAIVGTLTLFGILMIATVSAPLSLEKFGNTWHYLFHQIFLGLLPAIFLGILFFKIRLSTLKKYAVVLLSLNLIALILVFIPKIGVSIGGAHRWIALGSISFQPSEFLKISFLLYLAAWLSRRDKSLLHPSFHSGSQKRKRTGSQTLIAFLIILAVLACLLIKQPDMGTLMTIAITSASIYFITPSPFWHKISIIFAGIGVTILLIIIAPYRMERLMSFLHPELDPLNQGYQIHQSFISIGSGKIFGIGSPFGLGMSQQKFGFLPHSMSDSIFAIIGEEMGFIGCIVLVALFLTFAWKGLKIAKESPDNFSYLLALGITIWITIQAFLNMGAMTGLLPLTGIPLPFISYGGSHIIVELIGTGILLNISKNTWK
jgi:cell division protein FtsW